ncbi:MAG: 50S ribosomal protein L4 [Alphaproteobacteria bacterium]|nr:50S ribosomal protein L4 [Alphaproteobacteria bacterium]
MKLDVVTLGGDTAGSVELTEAVFGLEPRRDLLHRYVTWQLAKSRAGTHKIKTRSEVSYSTRKIVRQKGSGGARHGDRKVSQFRGGAKAHGPVLRSHAHDLPKRLRRLALRHALSAKAGAQELSVLDAAALAEAKTKVLKGALDRLGWTSVLIVDGSETDRNFALAARNLPQVDVLPVAGLNVYDILRSSRLVLTKSALAEIEARFAEGSA